MIDGMAVDIRNASWLTINKSWIRIKIYLNRRLGIL